MNINATQLYAMRDAGVNVSLPDLCDVYRATEVDDGAGGTRLSETAVYMAMACQVAHVTYLPTPQQGAGQPQEYMRQTVYFPHNADVQRQDTLRIYADGTLLRVLDVDPDRANALSKQVFCEKVVQ